MIMVYVAYWYMALMTLMLLYYGTGMSESVKGYVYRKRNHVVEVRFSLLPSEMNECWVKPPDVWAVMRNNIFEGSPTVPLETVPVYFKNKNTKAIWLLRNK